MLRELIRRPPFCAMDCLLNLSWWPKKATKKIFFEGNVGVGKTECIHYVAELLKEKGKKIKCIAEESERWASKGLLFDARSLDKCKNFAAYGALRDYMMREQFFSSAEMHTYDAVLIERHPSTVCEIFHDEDDDIVDLFKAADGAIGFLATPEITIYIKNSPHICVQRTRNKGRESELTLQEDDFIQFDRKFEEMMVNRQANGGKVFTIDAFGASSNHLSAPIVECIEKLLN